MGTDYAVVHLTYTIPVAFALTTLYLPLLTQLDVFKIIFLITNAVVYTIPWDSYLIRRRVWTYPSDVVLGPTIFHIPLEELFFFVVQTYNTSLLYLLLSKPTFFPLYLVGGRRRTKHESLKFKRNVGAGVIGLIIAAGGLLLWKGGEGLYMGLIMVWAGPVALMLWMFAYQLILGVSWVTSLAPIVVPTVYLWIVDTLALKRGTWVIESGTKLGIHLWEGLEIEEAVFFLATNVIIVFGLLAVDTSVSVLYIFPSQFPKLAPVPSPAVLAKGLAVRTEDYDDERIIGLEQAVQRLKKKSRSFYLASAVFEGRLRIDLTLLYSFCRVADDLVDNAPTPEEAQIWIRKMRQYLDISYGSKNSSELNKIISSFPKPTQSVFHLLPTHYLPRKPLYDLLEGFETDLRFLTRCRAGPRQKKEAEWPIQTESDLSDYARCVASTVAELCLELVFYHTPHPVDAAVQRRLVAAGGRMGKALQYVNIARDIRVDSLIQRVYLPYIWLVQVGLTPEAIIKDPSHLTVEGLRQRLLDQAAKIYREARGAIEELPVEARGPMRVAVESYMEIGRVLKEPGYVVKAGRATVPKWRRVRVAYRALRG